MPAAVTRAKHTSAVVQRAPLTTRLSGRPSVGLRCGELSAGTAHGTPVVLVFSLSLKVIDFDGAPWNFETSSIE